MIDHLDNLLRTVLLRDVDGLTTESQVRFQPPDDGWRTAVANLQVDGEPANAVNLYLTEIRANAQLRSQQRERVRHDGALVDRPAPMKIDCYYLVSAWSPATVTEQVEPTLDEHALLYRVLAALQTAAPLNPSRVYPRSSAAMAAVPELLRDTDLPTLVAPAEGVAKLAEFWAAMGTDHRWRPVVELVVTLPVAVVADPVGPLVTTQVIDFRGGAGPAQRWIRIGGTVRTGAGEPVDDAHVALETLDGARLHAGATGPDGRWTADGLPPGRYRLRTRVVGRQEIVDEIDVPSVGRGYDVTVGS